VKHIKIFLTIFTLTLVALSCIAVWEYKWFTEYSYEVIDTSHTETVYRSIPHIIVCIITAITIIIVTSLILAALAYAVVD